MWGWDGSHEGQAMVVPTLMQMGGAGMVVMRSSHGGTPGGYGREGIEYLALDHTNKCTYIPYSVC